MNKINKKILVAASLLGAITIAIGAFGAHGLKSVVSAEAAKTFETGVRYQMYHTLALLALAFFNQLASQILVRVFRLFVAGIVFFSGSIYLLTFKDLLPFPVSFLGPVTPLGGLLFICGWVYLGYGVYRQEAA